MSQIIIPNTCSVSKLDINYCEVIPNCVCKFWSCALSSTTLTLLCVFYLFVEPIKFIISNLLPCMGLQDGDLCHHSRVCNSSNKFLHTESSAFLQPSKYIQIYPLILGKLKLKKLKK